MTAFPLRHTPATNRLRELIATKLGRPLSVQIECALRDSAEFPIDYVAGVADWCGYVLGKSPSDATALLVNDAGRRWQIDLQFATNSASSPGPFARVCWLESGTAGESMHVTCEQGAAVITGATEITWRDESQELHDSLTSERPSADIILDRFCRHVVGGLVPVTDLLDALRSLRIAHSIRGAMLRASSSAID